MLSLLSLCGNCSKRNQSFCRDSRLRRCSRLRVLVCSPLLQQAWLRVLQHTPNRNMDMETIKIGAMRRLAFHAEKSIVVTSYSNTFNSPSRTINMMGSYTASPTASKENVPKTVSKSAVLAKASRMASDSVDPAFVIALVKR